MNRIYTQVWMEGHRSTGSSGAAHLVGTDEGTDFVEVCKLCLERNEFSLEHFDSVRLTWWGCRLFDNEEDARRSFG